MKRERVIIRNNKNEKLVGYLHKGNSKTLIIVCHGIESANNTSDIEMQDILVTYFSEIAFKTHASVFSFDFSGYGESEGKMFMSFRQRDVDLKHVIDYFATQYKKIILYGFSMGGISAVITSQKNKKVTGLITVNGFFTFNPKLLYKFQIGMLLSYILINPRFVLEILYWFKHVKIKEIAVPTFVVYGDRDAFVSPKQSIFFHNNLSVKKKTFAFESDDHTLRKENLRLPLEIGKWLQEERLV